MREKEENSPEQGASFIRDIAAVAAHAKSYKDGVDLVDRQQFWSWFTSDVVKEGKVDGGRIRLKDPDDIKKWIEYQVEAGKEKSLQSLLQGRSAEFDFVREKQNSLVELVQGNIWRRAPADLDKYGVDAIRSNVFSGGTETHQLKSGISDSYKSMNLSKYMEDGRQPVDVVQVNQKIMDWRESDKGLGTILKRGDDHTDVRQMMTDEQVVEGGAARIQEALDGEALTEIGLDNIADIAGAGSLTGAVLVVGGKVLTRYGAFKRGEISKEEFGRALASESAEVALRGGVMAVATVGVKVAVNGLAVGAPVTIPVLIVVGMGARSVIAPMFGRGAYAEQLKDIRITTDLVDGYANFMYSCSESLLRRQALARYLADYQQRSARIDEVSSLNNARLAELIRKGGQDE